MDDRIALDQSEGLKNLPRHIGTCVPNSKDDKAVLSELAQQKSAEMFPMNPLGTVHDGSAVECAAEIRLAHIGLLPQIQERRRPRLLGPIKQRLTQGSPKMTLNSSVKNLGGIHAALLTPFDKDDAIDWTSTEALVQFIIRQGVHGLYVGGSSGEAMLQSIDERAACLRHVADCARGKLKLIAHVGAVATRDVLKLAEVAHSSGYEAISAVTPYYYPFSRAEVMSHYRTVADNAALPLIIYNFPAITQAFSVAELANLLQHKNIIGVKHTSTDLFALERLRRHCPDALIYNGYDEMWLAGLSMGASGAIGTTYNLMGDVFVAIANLHEQAHNAEALELQKMANVIIEALIEVGVIPGCKMALDMMGVPVGIARPPFRQLTGEDRARMETALTPLLKWREGQA